MLFIMPNIAHNDCTISVYLYASNKERRPTVQPVKVRNCELLPRDEQITSIYT
jgi:hypothetical protein